MKNTKPLNLIVTTKFTNETITIEKLKQPYFNKDSKGIPVMSGFLQFSVKEGDNSYIEYAAMAEQDVFQDIVVNKLWRQPGVEIRLTFNDKGVVTSYEVTPLIPETSAFGFTIHPDDKKRMENEASDVTTKTPQSQDAECIIKILSKANNEGMFAEVVHIPKYAQTSNISEIVNEAHILTKKKKTIKARDILKDKYLVTDTGNNGSYIYVRTTPLSFI